MNEIFDPLLCSGFHYVVARMAASAPSVNVHSAFSGQVLRPAAADTGRAIDLLVADDDIDCRQCIKSNWIRTQRITQRCRCIAGCCRFCGENLRSQ